MPEEAERVPCGWRRVEGQVVLRVMREVERDSEGPDLRALGTTRAARVEERTPSRRDWLHLASPRSWVRSSRPRILDSMSSGSVSIVDRGWCGQLEDRVLGMKRSCQATAASPMSKEL